MTDKENGKNVEGGPWWVRLVKGSKTFPGDTWEKLKTWVRILRGDASEDVERVAIWSVHPRVQEWYFWVFAAQTFGITLPELLGRVRMSVQTDGWGTVLTAYKGAWDAISGQLLSAAITTLIVTEIGGSLAMIASRLYENLQRVRKQRRAEARAEFDAEIQAWYTRQQEALAKGEPFDEPPPRADQEESAD